jgi:hypothetical protein
MTWQVGDLALAVGVKREDFPGGYFAEGAVACGTIYRVAGVNFINGIIGLRFDGFPSPTAHGHWHSASFRKIHPDKAEQCEPEFITLLKRSKVRLPDKIDVNQRRAKHGNVSGVE